MPTTKEILISARKLIEKPENWGKGPCEVRGPGRICAEIAIDDTKLDGSHHDAKLLLVKAITGDTDGRVGMRIIDWNDHPDRTHAEVLAAFDKAIAECAA